MTTQPPRRPSMIERVRAVAQGRLDLWQPPTARRAATVALLRDGETGLEVYLIRRAAAMNFPAVTAYPGGGVEPQDGPPEHGETLARAAVREVLEETGVELNPEHVQPFARWITPEPLPVRFDTQFFAAALPSGQQPELRGTEADHGAWFNPGWLLANRLSVDAQLLPPTLATMHQLASHATVADALAQLARLPIVPLLPTPSLLDDQVQWQLLDASDRRILTDLSEVGIPETWRLDMEGMRS